MNNTDDQESTSHRDRNVYKYLLSLTDLNENSGKSAGKQYSISSIAMQWGTDRMYIKRILENLQLQDYNSSAYTKLPGLNLDRLVNILSTLRKYWLLKFSKEKESRRITNKEITKAIRLFCKLSPDQESKLGFKISQGSLLMEQLEYGINDLNYEIMPKVITKLYQHFISIREEYLEQKISHPSSDYILAGIRNELKCALNLADHEVKSEDVNKYYSKIISEVNKIQTENGYNNLIDSNQRANMDSGVLEPVFQPINLSSQISPYVDNFAIHLLIKSIIENEILTDSFPFHFKYFEVKKNRSLPLYLDSYDGISNERGVLNHEYHKKDSEDRVKSLKNLFSYTVRVHFYIKLPKNYNLQLHGRDQNLSVDSHPDGGMCINFFEEVSGVGSPLAHIIAAINQVLLWDIPLLKDYIPIAKNLIIENQVLGASPSSTIWGHNVVCLCKRDEIIKAINKKSYIFQSEECATGNYCGFDLLEVVGKAAFYARLRAIQQTGINPEEYIKQVINRISEVNALRKSEALLESYPFSMLAMEQCIENSIFEDGKYRESKKTRTNISFEEESSNPWSMVAYTAHLVIAEAYLKEGLYVVGRKYLIQIEQHINRYEHLIDSLIIARYYLSKFRYQYLIDRKGNEDTVENMLVRAKFYLQRYTQKCFAIDELPQINFHNFYYILSRIYAHEAKIHIFMNRNVSYEERLDKLNKATYAFEMSRINAAKEGNTSLYSMWSAYQSWCYVMLAYLDTNKRKFYLDWGSKLLQHALVCYAENGRKCYESIKAHSGKLDRPEKHGCLEITSLPLIQEIHTFSKSNQERDLYHDYSKPSDNLPSILELDLFILSEKYPESFGHGINKITYLCGMPSAILLFSLGIMELCQDKIDISFEGLEKAMSYFNYSWSIAEEGLREQSDGSFKRTFEREKGAPKEFSMSGLYPHRMTQFADFGKMFAIICELILVKVYKKKIEVTNINYLRQKIRSSNFSSSFFSQGQEKYNIHFDEIHIFFEEYISKIILEIEQDITVEPKETVIEIREKLVGDVFMIITTRSPA